MTAESNRHDTALHGQSRELQGRGPQEHVRPGPDRLDSASEPINSSAALSRRVLLADDTLGNRTFVSNLLTDRGHRVILAVDGQQAVQQFNEQAFDVVLLDLNMPVMDGWQTVETLRKLEAKPKAGSSPQHVCIIALTAEDVTDLKSRLQACGFDGYVGKPIEVERLLAAVENRFNEFPQGARSTAANSSAGYLGSKQEMEAAADGIIDLKATLRRLGGDHSLLKEFAEVFLEDSPEMMEKIRQGESAQDGESTSRAAHSLRGISANFGAADTVAVAAEIEKAALKRDWKTVSQAMPRLSNCVEELGNALRKLLVSLRI